MLRYAGGRLASGILTLFLFVSLLFFLVNILLPGDWVSQFILDAEAAAALRESLGLDRPLWQQYWDWLTGVFTLDLGQSFAGDDVWESLVSALPSTLLVLAIGLAIAFVLGGWLGRYSATEQRSYLSSPITFVAIVFLTAFPPVLAVLMEQGVLKTFGYAALGRLGTIDELLWFGEDSLSGSAPSPSHVMWQMLGVIVMTVGVLWVIERAMVRVARWRMPRWLFLLLMVGVPLLVWSQLDVSSYAFDLAATLTLLLTGVVLLTFGDVLLVTRASMDDVMLEDYVMVARAKGLPERDVRDKHAARTALLPVLSRFTVSIPYFLTGLIILEAVFAGADVAGVGFLQRFSGPSGLGSLLFRAVRTQDTFLVVGALLVIGVLTLMLRIGLDLAHAALDPRIRFGEEDAV